MVCLFVAFTVMCVYISVKANKLKAIKQLKENTRIHLFQVLLILQIVNHKHRYWENISFGVGEVLVSMTRSL